MGISKHLGVHKIILHICIQCYTHGVLKGKHCKVYEEEKKTDPHKLIATRRKPLPTTLALSISVYNIPIAAFWFFFFNIIYWLPAMEEEYSALLGTPRPQVSKTHLPINTYPFPLSFGKINIVLHYYYQLNIIPDWTL